MLPVAGMSNGTLQLTVHGRNLRPYLADVTVGNVAESLVLAEVLLDDDASGASQGDGDGQANPGETLELGLQLRNVGSEDASAITATLTCPEPWATVTAAGRS